MDTIDGQDVIIGDPEYLISASFDSFGEAQKAWSARDERQYEHVKESERERGKSEDRAEEIAARTVNKQRREDGRTKSGKQSA